MAHNNAKRRRDASEGIAYLAPLTGIRGVAALYVLVLHLNLAISAVDFSTWVRVIDHGYLGVDLFFILSGFILSHVYTASFENFTPRAYAVFMWHRFARIWPMHVATLAAMVVLVLGAGMLGMALNNPDAWRFTDIPFHILMVHAWGFLKVASWNAPSWSISAEWSAYILFPLALALSTRVRAALPGIAAALITLGVMAAIFRGFEWDLGHSWLGARAIARVLPEFLIGCFLYRIYLAFGRTSLGWDLAGAASLVLFVLVALYAFDDFLLIGLIALFVLASGLAAGPLRRFLSSRVMVFLGKISYSLYLVHFAYIVVLLRALDLLGLDDATVPEALAVMAVSIVICCALAAAGFFAVERPARNYLKARFE